MDQFKSASDVWKDKCLYIFKKMDWLEIRYVDISYEMTWFKWASLVWK